MAAGASSPELFTSFVALFVTHSAMGLGTVRQQYFRFYNYYVDAFCQ